MNSGCNAASCRVSAWWNRQPPKVQNALVALLGLAAVGLIAGLSHALDAGASAWTWHIPG